MRKCVQLGLIVLLMGAMAGCDKLRGEKGETGSSGLIGTKTYTGTPNANPFTVNCPEIQDISRQVISVYVKRANGDLMPLPASYQDEYNREDVNTTYRTIVSHSYVISGQNIVIKTDSPLNSSALMEIDRYTTSSTWVGTQNDYRIEIKTFASGSAALAYKKSLGLDKSMYNEILFGKETR